MDEFSFFFLLFVLLSFFSLFFSSSFCLLSGGCVMDDPELVMLAARLVQCAPGDVMAVRWRGDGWWWSGGLDGRGYLSGRKWARWRLMLFLCRKNAPRW